MRVTPTKVLPIAVLVLEIVATQPALVLAQGQNNLGVASGNPATTGDLNLIAYSACTDDSLLTGAAEFVEIALRKGKTAIARQPSHNHGFAGTDPASLAVTNDEASANTGDPAAAIADENASFDPEAARSQILAGVATLSDPGSPGHMVVYGLTAYSIANYPGSDLSDPMIAAATLGLGRLLALPDHQWLNLQTLGGDASMATFYQNSIAWLADSAGQSVKIVTYNNPANADWLSAQGYTDVVNATSATLAADLVDARVFVAGWLGSNVPDAVLNTVSDHVRGGVGLFIADYGIGYDWWWNTATPEIATNRLLRDAGVGFTTNWPHSGAQSVSPATGQMTYQDVLTLLQDSSGAAADEKDQAAAIYSKLNEVLAPDDPLQLQLDAEFWARINSINPTPATPVSDSFEQALLKREMDLIKDLPANEVTAHRTAEALYGSIDPNAPRLIDRAVTINTDTTGWLPTGMYAAPGEQVTLNVPATLVGQGHTARVSGHWDNISGRSDWNRVPYGVSRAFAIDSSSIDIAGAFGGAIYLDVGGEAGGIAPNLGNVNITIDGAIEAPMFVLGQSTNTDWVNSIRDNPAAYAEFVSDHLSFSVPAEWIRTLDDPAALMTYWDEAVAFQDWVGGFENLRTGPDRVNIDVQISVGWLHAGYPIQGPVIYGDGPVKLDHLLANGDWGWFHELGHEMQRHPELGWGWDNPWTFSGDTEVTVNIFANAALELMVTDIGTSGWGYSAHPDEVMTRAATTVNDSTKPGFDAKDPYPFYFQLADGHWGWQGYRDVLSGYVLDQLTDPAALPQNQQEEKDQWLIRWSQEHAFDMTEFMVNRWGLEVSQAALDEVAAMVLPGWMPLALSIPSLHLTPGESETLNLADAGLSLDGIATLVAVGTASEGLVIDQGNGNYTYLADPAFSGQDSFTATYESSAGNQQTFAIDILISIQGVLLETFANIPGSTIMDLTASTNYPSHPDSVDYLGSFEAPTDAADNYGLRARAHLSVPTTGDYTFWIASDDNGELWLSSDHHVANASLIASVPSWTSSREWDKYAEQQSPVVSLNAGEEYYIEALMKEGGGGDNLAIAWSGPDIADPTVIDGQYLTIYGVSTGNLAPTAGFTDSCTDLDCNFTDTSTDSDGTIDSWSWNFGDGGTSTAQSPSHSYAAPGSYQVNLTVTDDDGASDNTSGSVTVTAAPFNDQYAISSNTLEGTVRGSYADTHADDDVVQAISERQTGGKPSRRRTSLQHRWTFNVSPGTSMSLMANAWISGPADVDQYMFSYSTDGSNFTDLFTVSSTDNTHVQVAALPASLSGMVVVQVVDSDNAQGETVQGELSVDELVIRIANTPVTPPMAGFNTSCTELDCGFTDTSTDADGSLLSWSWNFGDGNTSTAQNPNHQFAASGTYTVGLTVTDNDGASDTTSASVTVTGTPPPLADIHVGDLIASVSGKKRWTANVTITVHDDTHTGRSGIAVNGHWSGGSSANDSCVTGDNGQCSLSHSTKGTNLTFTVDLLSGPGLAYQPLDNDVTSITVNRP